VGPCSAADFVLTTDVTNFVRNGTFGDEDVAAAAPAVMVVTRDEGMAVCLKYAKVGPGGCCSPRHRVTFDSRDEGSKCVE